MTKSNFLLLIFGALLFCSCKYDKLEPSSGGFPKEIGSIFRNNCAVSGCHNTASAFASSGLDLSSWETLFKGNRSGAAVIPYSSEQSYLMNFVNTYPELGITQLPVMPPNGSPVLSANQVTMLKNWINAGAPSIDGKVMFSDNPNRKKFYVVNQGCDIVTVFDADSRLAMRYIPVGTGPQIESPHKIMLSPDLQHWYVIFLGSNVIQKYRTSDDVFVGQAIIGSGNWNTFVITPDSRYAFIVDFNPNGKVVYVDLEELVVKQTYGGQNFLVNPHGIWADSDFDTLYVTPQYGNFVYRLDITDPLNPEKLDDLVLDPGQPASTNSTLNAHQAILSPDGSKLFVTCQKSNEVRIMDPVTDNLLKVIPVGNFPQEVSFSTRSGQPYVFITCEEDTSTFSGEPDKRGSVYIINYETLEVVQAVYTGYQPHGISVDNEKGLVYVPNRNINPDGDAPHHTTTCGTRPGYVTAIDINTLALLPGFKAWISVDPYSVDTRNP